MHSGGNNVSFSGSLDTISLLVLYWCTCVAISVGVACSSCVGDGRRGLLEIGWILLASATSGFSVYIKLSTVPLPRGFSSSVVRASD